MTVRPAANGPEQVVLRCVTRVCSRHTSTMMPCRCTAEGLHECRQAVKRAPGSPCACSLQTGLSCSRYMSASVPHGVAARALHSGCRQSGLPQLGPAEAGCRQAVSRCMA